MKYTCEAMRRMSQNPNQKQEGYYYHPYRQRKNSTTSTYSDCSSTSGSPSGSTITSPPPPPPPPQQPPQTYNVYETPVNLPYPTHPNIYDRLKQYMDEVPKDPLVCQILLDSLARVIQLERHLEDLEQKTNHLKMRQQSASAPDSCPTLTQLSSPPAKWHHTPSNEKEKVPEDLANVDVSEFRHLVHSSPPLVYETISY